MSGTHHSLVALSGDSQREELLSALMADVNDYDTIFVESIQHGYSRIKEVTPDLVLVYSEIDDVAACQLLSMLKMDDDLWSIPVVTYSIRGVTDAVGMRTTRPGVHWCRS
jgi:hypothetical protein